ncbi:hypothetical protein [Modestobacter lacusdianchii]
MIRPPQARLNILAGPFTYATQFIDRSGAVPLVEQWLLEDSAPRSEAKATSASTGAYSARALLIGLYLLIITRQPISWASLLQMYWFQLDRQQITQLGLAETIDPERQRWLTSFTAEIDTRWPKEALAIQQSEYARLARSLDRTFDTIRWSPHDRTGKKTNAELKKRIRTLTDEEREVMTQKKERHDLLVNTLIAASVDPSLLSSHRGDIMFDEVVIRTAKPNGKTGTKAQARHTGNPDAGWFMKKQEISSATWGHGATFIMATHRPGQKRIPIVVVGMSLGKPTGGDVDETMLAIEYAEKTGLLTPRAEKGRSRFAIADLGFTRKSRMNENLTAKGYYLVQDYRDGDTRRFELQRPANTSTNVETGDELRIVDNGPTLFNGVLICPGFSAATKDAFNPLSATATEAERLAHEQREAQLLAGRMHPNGRPDPARHTRRGRPSATSLPIETIGYRVQAQCPAASGQCRCPIVSDSLALGAEVPSVIDEPDMANLPYVCAKSISPVLMDVKQFKQYGVHLFGSAEHKKLYGYARSLNEQWHSQFRADHTGGIDGAVFNTLGVERIGVIIALAVAETNQASQRAFRHKHEDRDSLAAA